MIADPLRAQYDMLSDLSYTDGVTEEQLRELERIQEDHPDWSPEEDHPVEPDTFVIPRSAAPFTESDLLAIVKSQNCDLIDLKKLWIIQRDNAFYVMGKTGEYRPPIIKGALAVSLPRDLARVPSVTAEADTVPDGYICWERKEGERTRKKTVDEMLQDYATVARKVVASMSIEHSFYDPETEIFYERACPLRHREIVPAYNAEVDHWLGLLGGEKLKDWVAVATYLNRPVCAVYIHGCKDAGKTMFAAGISRLWGEAPTELESAYDTFNSAITDNPLIFADEELPKGMTSGFLRKFVGQGTHPLRRKNMPEAKLLGCFRLVIAANNDTLLKFDDEHFSPEDIEAIAARLLYVKSDPGAAEYLRELGGRNGGTANWVDGDVIAAHALWLRDNREVIFGERFLVAGKITDIHRRIATHGSVRGLVIEWICKAMVEKSRWSQKNPGIRFGGGHLYVNASYVKQTWEEVTGDNRVPSLKTIGIALRPLQLKGATERRFQLGDRRADFYDIDPDHIYDACKDLQVGVVEDYRALIERLVAVEGEATPQNGSVAKGLFEGVELRK